MKVFTVLGAIVRVLIIMNEAISACRFLNVKGSYMRVFTVLREIVLVLIMLHEAISACRFLKMEGSYMWVWNTVLSEVWPMMGTKACYLEDWEFLSLLLHREGNIWIVFDKRPSTFSVF